MVLSLEKGFYLTILRNKFQLGIAKYSFFSTIYVGDFMSVLKVSGASFSFGSRTIMDNVSFTLNKGEHIALVGANGEGKSTFVKMITGGLSPDEGKIEWTKRVTFGYLDQYTTLDQGKTIKEVLRDAFKDMFELESEMYKMYDQMATANEDEMNKMLEDIGEIQSYLEHSGFYTLDAKLKR